MKRPSGRPEKLNRTNNFRLARYLRINLVLGGIIILIFVYSGIFSAENNRYPIPSFYERVTGLKSPTSGLSRSFSEIVRGRFNLARSYNASGIPIFAFFLIQLLLRAFTSLLITRLHFRTRIVAIPDIIASILLFIYCFRNLLQFYLTNVIT